MFFGILLGDGLTLRGFGAGAVLPRFPCFDGFGLSFFFFFFFFFLGHWGHPIVRLFVFDFPAREGPPAAEPRRY